MRTTRRRAGILIAAIASVGLCVAACDDSPKPAGKGQGSGKSNYQQAVAFSKCMRSNGDPSFPDPGPNGAFPNQNGSLDRNSPQFKKAAEACKKLEPSGGSAADFQKDYQQLLKYSACMRAHGLPDFPDPVLEEHGVGINGKLDMKSPQFKTANAACKSLQPGAGGP